jgi:Thioesterase domain/Phosphopantetheine attachment site
LGGHSLLAIKLVHAMKVRLALAIPLAAVFTAPSVATMAALGQCDRRLASLVVPIQTRVRNRPLFCIHPVGGQVSFYQALAGQLADRYSVYGIQSPEVLGQPLAFDCVEDMAVTYGATIRATQPTGPYRLLGWSTGGVIAAAIARYLVEQGEQIDYLGLIDSRSIFTEVGSTDDQLMRQAATVELRGSGLLCVRRKRAKGCRPSKHGCRWRLPKRRHIWTHGYSQVSASRRSNTSKCSYRSHSTI